jgi:hypothetical protein
LVERPSEWIGGRAEERLDDVPDQLADRLAFLHDPVQYGQDRVANILERVRTVDARKVRSARQVGEIGGRRPDNHVRTQGLVQVETAPEGELVIGDHEPVADLNLPGQRVAGGHVEIGGRGHLRQELVERFDDLDPGIVEKALETRQHVRGPGLKGASSQVRRLRAAVVVGGDEGPDDPLG